MSTNICLSAPMFTLNPGGSIKFKLVGDSVVDDEMTLVIKLYNCTHHAEQTFTQTKKLSGDMPKLLVDYEYENDTTNVFTIKGILLYITNPQMAFNNNYRLTEFSMKENN
jgi:hypothetical protein